MAPSNEKQIQILKLKRQKLVLQQRQAAQQAQQAQPAQQAQQAQPAQQAQQQEEPQQEEPSMLSQVGGVAESLVRGGIKGGVYDAVDAAGGLVTGPASWLLEKWLNKQAAEKGIKDFDADINLPSITDLTSGETGKQLKKTLTQRVTPKGENVLNDMARTFGEWSVGGVTKAGKIKGLMSRLAPDVYMGAGAAVGEQIGGDTGEIAGGILGLLRGNRRAVKLAAPEAETRAANYISQNAANTDDATANIQAALREGDRGTITDLSLDQGIADIEQAAINRPQKGQGAGLRAGVDEELAARQEQMMARMKEPFGEGVPGAAEESAWAITDQAKKTASVREAESVNRAGKMALDTTTAAEARQVRNNELATAHRNRAKGQNIAVDPNVTPPVASAKVQANFEALTAELHDKAKVNWAKVDEGHFVDVEGLQGDVAKLLDELPPNAAKDLQAKYSTLFKHIENTGGGLKLEDPKALQYLLSTMKEITREAKLNGSHGYLEKSIGELTGTTQKFMENSLNGPDFKKAVEATRDKHFRAGGKRLEKAFRGSPEEFMEAMGTTGSRGATLSRRLNAANDPRIDGPIQDYIAAEATKEISKNGKLSPAFVADRADLLNRYPDLKADLSDATRFGGSVRSAEKRVKTGKSVLKSARQKAENKLKDATNKARMLRRSREGQIAKTEVERYAQGGSKRLKSLLKEDSPKARKSLETLRKAMKSRGLEADFKAHVGDLVSEISAPLKGGLPAVKEGSIDKFTAIKDKLVKTGVLTEKEAGKVRKGLEKARSAKIRKEAVAARVNRQSSEVESLVASLVSAGFLTTLSGSQSLLVGGATRRLFKRILMQRKFDARVMKKMDEFILDPEKYIKAAEGAKTANEASRSIASHLFGASATTSALNENEE